MEPQSNRAKSLANTANKAKSQANIAMRAKSQANRAKFIEAGSLLDPHPLDPNMHILAMPSSTGEAQECRYQPNISIRIFGSRGSISIFWGHCWRRQGGSRLC